MGGASPDDAIVVGAIVGGGPGVAAIFTRP
jgi:hypothetical protein